MLVPQNAIERTGARTILNTAAIAVYDKPDGPLVASDCRVAAPKLQPKKVDPKIPYTELQGCSHHDRTTANIQVKK